MTPLTVPVERKRWCLEGDNARDHARGQDWTAAIFQRWLRRTLDRYLVGRVLVAHPHVEKDDDHGDLFIRNRYQIRLTVRTIVWPEGVGPAPERFLVEEGTSVVIFGGASG